MTNQINSTLENKYEAILAALRVLSHQCDGAQSEDGVGFNKPDSARGKRFAQAEELDDSQARWAWETLRKYSAQLAAAEISFGELPEPPKTERKHNRHVSRVIAQSTLRFSQDYEDRKFGEIKGAIKSQLAGRYDGIKKAWDVAFNAKSQQAILDLVDTYDFELSAGAIELLNSDPSALPKSPATAPPKRTASVSGSGWLIQWSKDDPAFSDLLNAIKALPTRRYDGDKVGWVCPASSALLAICDKYEILGREGIRAAINSQPEKQSAPVDTGEIESRLAAIEAKLLPYQVPAVRAQVTALNNGGALDASDTGTGKTYIGLASCYVLNRPVFVICPKAVIPQWKAAAKHFGIELAGICNYELLRRGEQPAIKSITFGKGKSFKWQLPLNTVILFDECHRMKDYKTSNNQLGMSALRQRYTVLGMSATAADNPLQMKFSGLLTKQFGDERGFWGWAMDNGVRKNRFGYEFSGSRTVLAKIHGSIFPTHGTRVRIADLGDAFPETQIAAEAYDMNGDGRKIQKIYDEMESELARLTAKIKEDGDPIPLTIRLRARQMTETLKVPVIAEIAQDAVDSGMSVAIFVNFNETADALCEKLKTTCSIRGGQSDEARAKNIADFQADREPIIVCNIKAGGVGVSLHGTPESRTRLSLICPTDSGQDLKQALGRVWRANGAKSIQRIVFAADTIEAEVCANVKAKIARIDTINDGDLSIGAK